MPKSCPLCPQSMEKLSSRTLVPGAKKPGEPCSKTSAWKEFNSSGTSEAVCVHVCVGGLVDSVPESSLGSDYTQGQIHSSKTNAWSFNLTSTWNYSLALWLPLYLEKVAVMAFGWQLQVSPWTTSTVKGKVRQHTTPSILDLAARRETGGRNLSCWRAVWKVTLNVVIEEGLTVQFSNLEMRLRTKCSIEQGSKFSVKGGLYVGKRTLL